MDDPSWMRPEPVVTDDGQCRVLCAQGAVPYGERHAWIASEASSTPTRIPGNTEGSN